MNLGLKDRQTLFNLKVKEGKSETTAAKEVIRDVNWIKKFEETKKQLLREIRDLEQKKINLQVQINKLLERERKLS